MTKPSNLSVCSVALATLFGLACLCEAQVVTVTMSLDSPSIAVGDGTTLRVYAQVVPAVRTNADRIFSWYVDVLNTNGAAAAADYEAMSKSASDNDPLISSNGIAQGADRVGINDTFLNLPDAGVSNAVELMAIPVTGLASGKTRFRVRAGTGVPALSDDFIVAPKGGGSPLVGGDYASAFVDLAVVTPCTLAAQIGRQTDGTIQVSFTPCEGRNHMVEYSDGLNGTAVWQQLPGSPYNSGILTITNVPPARSFRVTSPPP